MGLGVVVIIFPRNYPGQMPLLGQKALQLPCSIRMPQPEVDGGTGWFLIFLPIFMNWWKEQAMLSNTLLLRDVSKVILIWDNPGSEVPVLLKEADTIAISSLFML